MKVADSHCKFTLCSVPSIVYKDQLIIRNDSVIEQKNFINGRYNSIRFVL